jgi:hypothetical protein
VIVARHSLPLRIAPAVQSRLASGAHILAEAAFPLDLTWPNELLPLALALHRSSASLHHSPGMPPAKRNREEESSGMAAMESALDSAQRKRPRFAREVETLQFRLPAGRQIASVLAVAVAAGGDIFLLHQPNAQGLDPGSEHLACWLPPLVHLSAKGDFIDAWGGADQVPSVDGVSQWPEKLEGLECDANGDLWVFGYGANDNAVLRFSASGELLQRIGQRGKRGADTDTNFLGSPTACYHDIGAHEVFIADGYGNHRVIAFNSQTGAFTRMWGAYGRPVTSPPPADGFGSPVHKVAVGPGNRLYVADRTKSRIQEFEISTNAVSFTREVTVAPGTLVQNTGSAWDIGFAPEGGFMYVADGPNFRVWTIDLETFEVLGSSTVHTEYENTCNEPLHFSLVHRFAVEADGNLLLACVNGGLKRLRLLGGR